MELAEAYRLMDKTIAENIKELEFKKMKTGENELGYKSEKGLFRVSYDAKTNIMSLECSYEDKGEDTAYETISKSLFELDAADEKECRYYRAGGLQYSDEKTWLLACKLQRFFPGVLYSHEPVLGEQGPFGSNAG